MTTKAEDKKATGAVKKKEADATTSDAPEIKKPAKVKGFDSTKPYGQVAGCSGTAYFQDGKYYDASGKPTKGPV